MDEGDNDYSFLRQGYVCTIHLTDGSSLMTLANDSSLTCYYP